MVGILVGLRLVGGLVGGYDGVLVGGIDLGCLVLSDSGLRVALGLRLVGLLVGGYDGLLVGVLEDLGCLDGLGLLDDLGRLLDDSVGGNVLFGGLDDLGCLDDSGLLVGELVGDLYELGRSVDVCL